MNITFTPSLGEAVTVPISDCCDEQDIIILRFVATLGYQEYRQAAEGRAKVQLWSDIASPEGDTWRAYDFVIEGGHSETVLQSNAPNSSIRLGHYVGTESELTSQHRLVAHVPISIRNARNFSFTYRIQYEFGDIKWLGAYGHNGYAVITRDLPRGLDLAQGWTQCGRIFDLDSPAVPVTIASFSITTDYNIWAFPRDSHTLAWRAEGDAELLIAIPRDLGLYSTKPSYIIQASPNAMMYLDSAGSVRASGSGNIMSHACYDLSRLEALLHLRPLHSGGQVELRTIHERETKYLMIASRKTKAPVKIAVIPLGSARETVVEVGLDILFDVLGETDATQLAIYSPTTAEICSFHSPFTQRTSFIVPKSGGEFILTSIHDFESQESGKETDCKIAFLTPFLTISRGVEGKVTLPTPPPSPQIQTRRSPQISFVLNHEAIPDAPSPNDSISSQGLRRRSGRASSSLSEHNPATPRLEQITRHGVLFSLLLGWVRYVAILLSLFGIRLDKFRGNVTLPVEEEDLSADTLASLTDQGHADEGPTPDGCHTNLNETSHSQGRGGISSEGERPVQSNANTKHAEEIARSPPEKDISHSTPPPLAAKALVQAFYTKVPYPPVSPFSPRASQDGIVALVLSVQDNPAKYQPGTQQKDESIPISSLHKALTVDGNIPEELQLTELGEKTIVDGVPNRWSHYLVRFSVSTTPPTWPGVSAISEIGVWRRARLMSTRGPSDHHGIYA